MLMLARVIALSDTRRMIEHRDEPRTAYDFLAEGGWHPVASPIQFNGNAPATFWVTQDPDNDDFLATADGYRVDYEPETFTREGDTLAAIGKSALIPYPHLLHLRIDGNEASVKIEQTLPKLFNEVFDDCLKHAVLADRYPDAPITYDQTDDGNELKLTLDPERELILYTGSDADIILSHPFSGVEGVTEYLTVKRITRAPEVSASYSAAEFGMLPGPRHMPPEAVIQVAAALELAKATMYSRQDEYKESQDLEGLAEYSTPEAMEHYFDDREELEARRRAASPFEPSQLGPRRHDTTFPVDDIPF